MPQPKGQTGNLNGRPKGKPNKITTSLKQIVKDFLDNNAKSLQQDFEALEPKDRLQFYEKLLKYAIPTQTANEINLNTLSDETLDIIMDKITNFTNE